MRGYCPTCKEFRSDAGENAWSIVWRDAVPVCEKCGSFVDVWNNSNLSEKPTQRKTARKECKDSSKHGDERHVR